MARSKSWSVKGIAPDVRDTARDAAQAAGLPIGAWIDNAILKASRGELPNIAGTPATPSAPDTASAPPDSTGTTGATAGSAGIMAGTMTTPSTAESDTYAPGTESPSDTGARSAPEFVVVPGGAPAQASPILPPQENYLHQSTAYGTGGAGLQPGERAVELPSRRIGIVRYVAVAVVLLILATGAGWLFIELSTPERRPPVPAIAEAPVPTAATDAPAPGDQVPPAAAPQVLPAGVPAELAKAAAAGTATAQYDLGMLYLAGTTVPKDTEVAAQWFEKAAMQGLAQAQFNLGVLYQQGDGVAQDQQLAFFWYQSAAEQNYPRAEHNLATAYADGRGVTRNEAKAIEWFSKAAENGIAESQHSLGLIYERGYGTVSPDPSVARTWYARAAAQGYAPAAERLAAVERQLSATNTSADATASITPETPSEPVESEGPLTRAEIRDIQRLLNVMNFDAGPADGQIGRRTNSAISLYQRFAGFPETGKASRALLEDLRAVAKSMAPKG